MSTVTEEQHRRIELERHASEAREALAHDLGELGVTAEHATHAAVREVKTTGVAVGLLAVGALGIVSASLMRGAAHAVRGAAAGALAGVGAGVAMNQVHAIWSAAEKRLGIAQPSGGGESATVNAAEALVGPIPDERKPIAGTIAHFVMSGVTGAMYGVLAELAPQVRLGRGLAYGAAVWLGADEGLVPALGLAKRQTALRVHARALVAHLVYGAVLDAAAGLLAPPRKHR